MGKRRDSRAPPDERSSPDSHRRNDQAIDNTPEQVRARPGFGSLLDHANLSLLGLEEEGFTRSTVYRFRPEAKGAAMLKPVTSALAVVEPENLIWSAMIGISWDCWPKPLPPLTLTVCVAV